MLNRKFVNKFLLLVACILAGGVFAQEADETEASATAIESIIVTATTTTTKTTNKRIFHRSKQRSEFVLTLTTTLKSTIATKPSFGGSYKDLQENRTRLSIMEWIQGHELSICTLPDAIL